MDNSEILQQLERHRDVLYNELSNTCISELYRSDYEEIKSGRVFVPDDEKEKMLSELEKLSRNNSLDPAYHAKIAEYVSMNNQELIAYFQQELLNLFDEIASSGKQDDIQALFIEYDDYYDYTAQATAYGRQHYPLVIEPRYITDEYDYKRQVLLIENAIDFTPAWPDCTEFDDLYFLEVGYDLQQLFNLHSRTLLHKALDRLNGHEKLSFLTARPFMFYINEHDCEVMTLYKLD